MGFMEGFATAFGNQISAGRERREAAKQDAFRIAYTSYLNKKTQYDADKKADQSYIDAAKAAVGSVPNVPEGAWEHAYQWLRAGSSFDNVVKRLQASSFASIQTPTMDETTGLEAINQQTDQMLQTNTAQPTTGQPPSSTAPGQFINPFDREATERRKFDMANQSVMGAAGIDQATFDSVNAGYQKTVPPHTTTVTAFDQSAMDGTPNAGSGEGAPFDKNKAVVGKVNGQWIDLQPLGGGLYRAPNGEEIRETQLDAPTMTVESRANIEALAGKIGTKATQAIENRANTVSLLQKLNNLDAIAQANPNVLTKTNIMSVLGNEITNEIFGLGDQLQDMMATTAWAEKEQQWENTIAAEINNQGWFQNAADGQRFASALIDAAFTKARINNGTGALSGPDVKMAFDELTGTNDKVIFSDNMKQIANMMLDKSNTEMQNMIRYNIDAQALRGYQGGEDLLQMFERDSRDDLPPELKAWAATMTPVGSSPNGAPQDMAPDNKGQGVKRVVDDALIKAFGLDPSMKGKTMIFYENAPPELVR